MCDNSTWCTTNDNQIHVIIDVLNVNMLFNYIFKTIDYWPGIYTFKKGGHMSATYLPLCNVPVQWMYPNIEYIPTC